MVLTRKYVLIHRKTYFIAQVILFVVQKDVNAVLNIILYALVLFVVQKALHWFAAFIVVILKHLAVVRNVATFSKHAVVLVIVVILRKLAIKQQKNVLKLLL